MIVLMILLESITRTDDYAKIVKAWRAFRYIIHKGEKKGISKQIYHDFLGVNTQAHTFYVLVILAV